VHMPTERWACTPVLDVGKVAWLLHMQTRCDLPYACAVNQPAGTKARSAGTAGESIRNTETMRCR